LYNSLCKSLKEFEEQKLIEWVNGVEEHTEEHLNKYLLVKEDCDYAEEGSIRVNFDPTLIRLLREVKYLQLIDIEVPERAAQLYSKVNQYRNQTGNLEITVNMFNEVLATLLNVEKPLMADRIQMMLDSLNPGLTSLKWNSDGINPFINKALKICTEVDELVKKMKENVKKMQDIMKSWNKPLYERKNKALPAEDVEQTHQALVGPRLEDVRNNGKEIHRLMKDTQDNIKPDKKAPQWLSYQDYINGLIIEGITEGINGSM
jgi:dynein heavy chain